MSTDLNVNVLTTEPTLSSLEIAELTGKQHNNVLRDIDEIVKLLNLNQNSNLSSGFKSSTYKSVEDGRSYRCYELDKDSTLCLLAGYDAVARMKIVKRWQQLEDQVREEQQPKLPETYLEALKALVVSEEEKAALQSQNNAQWEILKELCSIWIVYGIMVLARVRGPKSKLPVLLACQFS